MTLGAPARARAALRFFAGAACALVASAAHATPPAFTGSPIVADPLNGFFLVNLRQQGVISGTAPIAISVGTVRVNGVPDTVIGVMPYSTTPGAVCLRIEDNGYNPSTHTSASVDLLATNLLGQTTTGTVSFSLQPGPIVNENDPQQLLACSDPNTPPVANAGGDRSVADTDGQPGETVLLDGSASSDADAGTVLT